MSRRALPYDVIMADPPWQFGDKLPGNSRGAEKHYGTMSIGALRDYLHVSRIDQDVAESAVLFLWKVAAIPDWLLVCRDWGFEPVAEVVWVKTGIVHPHTSIESVEPGEVCVDDGGFTKLAFGMGRKVRNCHEVCIIAHRGKPIEVADKSIRSVFFAPVREHSRKPDEAYRIVERLYPRANRLELFSRQHRDGWTCVGNEVGTFGGTGE